MIVHDSRNERASAIRAELDHRLPPGFDAGVVLVIGGDGFLLQTASRLGWDHVYLGLNAGHLGFLLNDVESWEVVVDQLERRAFTARAFPLLEASIELEDGAITTERALNDVYLERMTGQTARLTLSFDGHRVVEKLVADGIIFSTALGSTAYAFSAGGPACHPTLDVITVTPICPHLPRLPPVALPVTARARVEVLHPEFRPVRAVADGRELNRVRAVEVFRSGTQVKLAYLEGHDFTSRMIRKLLRS